MRTIAIFFHNGENLFICNISGLPFARLLAPTNAAASPSIIPLLGTGKSKCALLKKKSRDRLLAFPLTRPPYWFTRLSDRVGGITRQRRWPLLFEYAGVRTHMKRSGLRPQLTRNRIRTIGTDLVKFRRGAVPDKPR